MDEETRAAFDEMRRRFDGVDQRFDGVDQRFVAVSQFFVDVNERFAEVNQRFETVMDEIRRNGVLIEDLRTQIQVVAEGGRTNERALERLRAEMHERFRENEIIVGGAFRQIRRDIDELRH